MFNFLFDVVLMVIGFTLMITGWIEWVYIGFMIYLFISLIANIILYYLESTK